MPDKQSGRRAAPGVRPVHGRAAFTHRFEAVVTTAPPAPLRCPGGARRASRGATGRFGGAGAGRPLPPRCSDGPSAASRG